MKKSPLLFESESCIYKEKNSHRISVPIKYCEKINVRRYFHTVMLLACFVQRPSKPYYTYARFIYVHDQQIYITILYKCIVIPDCKYILLSHFLLIRHRAYLIFNNCSFLASKLKRLNKLNNRLKL